MYVLIISYTYFANNNRKSEISETLQDLTLTVDSAAKTSLINSPFPLIILETDGNVVWKSSKFASEFEDIENYLWLFTKDWPLVYEVYDKKDQLSVQIIGETNVYEKVKTFYKVELNQKKKPVNFIN